MKGRVVSGNEFGDILQVVRPNGEGTAEQKRAVEEQQRRAARVVAGNALDGADGKDLLDMLGLLDVQLLLSAKKRRPRVKRRAKKKRSA